VSGILTYVSYSDHYYASHEEKDLSLGNTVSIYKEFKHRIINDGKIPLVIIEVQVGEYCGEDDITRYEDEYGRPTTA